ncbi:MAG: Ig-like domain repeat protein [Gemmataceae bacterium]
MLINRFIVGVLDIDPASHLSNFLIAVSTTATPTTLTAADWNFYAIPVATLSQEIGFDANFPGNYGYNSDAFVLTLNMFGGSTLDHVLVTSVKAADLANHTANAITAASESGGVATITVANPIAGLRAGQSVTIQGVSPGGFNGTFLVTGVSGNTFTYATTPGIGTGTVGVNSQAFWAAAYQNDVAASNLRPTTMHGSIPGDPMWLLTEGGNNQSLKVYRMTNVLSNSAAFNVYRVGVNSYAQAVAPSDPGGSLVGTAGIVDSRILKAAESNNVLVAAHTVSVSATEDAVRWYAIDVSTGTPLIADQGDVSFGNNTYSFDPAIDINARDDIGLTFMRSATGTVTTRTLSAYITGRSPLDAAGSMQTPVRIQAGAANYGDSSTGGPNVGQISGIALDPTDGSFWAVTEYATGAANNNWATRIANFSVAVSATDPGVLVNNGATLELSGAKTATITNATAAGTTVTITASAPVTGLAAGQKVTISGILTPGYNGTFTVATVSGNQFTYVAPVAPGGSPAVLGATPKATYGINVAEVLTLNGTGVGGNGSLVNLLGDNRWTSAVTLPTAVNINVAANSSLTITGVVKDPVPVPSTPATVDKTGQGLLALTNTNTYTGQTNVDVGTVEVDGPNGVIGVVSLNGGTLGGTGTVGTVTTATSGTVNPGLVATPGTLKSSSETWNATTNFFVDLNSTASYDKLNVTGNVDLNNTFLTGSAGPALNIGDTFDILTYTGALSGQFTGVAPGGTVQLIADGGTVFIAGQKFTLNYVTASKLVRLTRQVTNVVFISQAVQSVAAPFGSTSAYGVDIAFTVTFQSEAGTLNSGVVDFTFNGHTVTKTITNNKAVALLSDFLLDFPLDASASAYTMDWAFNGGNGFTPIDANNPGAVGTAGSLGNTGNPAHMTFNVTVATPTVNVTGPSTALYGETKKFTATVVPPGSGTPTGSVLFVFHSTGNPDISFNGVGQGGGVWTVDIGLASGNVLTPRTYTVEAQYTSDHTTTRFVSQNGSKAGTFVVSQANASFTSFTAAPSSPQNYGTQVTFSVQVDPGTGSVGDILGQKVIFNDNGVPLNGTGTALVSDGFGHAVASYQTGATQLSANFGASHVITATLAPNGNYAGSNATLSGGYTVNQITPAVFTLSLSEPSISQGRNEIATATITNPVGAPTGTVTFYIDAVGAGNSLGTGTYDSLTQTWTRSFSTAGLSGAHTVFAVYGGDANFIGGGQQSTGMTVNPNFPPSFTGPMPDLSFSHTTASVNVNLTGVDPNGDPLTYTVTYVKYNDLVNLNNTYHFFTDPNASPADPYHQNNLSGNDPFYNGTRWIYSNFNGANAYYLKTDGSLYRWGGKTTSNAHTFDTLITKLPFFVYDDPSLLFNPLTPVDPAPVQKSVSGNVLTIDPPAVFRGIFQVQVSVSDGVVTVGPQLFNVYVSDNPPSLDPVGDQQLVHTAGSINVALSPHDVDSDPISYNVTLSQYTVLTSLNATYHFFTDPNASPADPYHQNNLAGNDAFYNGTRWFYSNFGGSTGAYYLKTDGSLYRWGGSTAGNAHTFDTLITKVPAFVYTDPMLLINAQTQPNPNAGGVTTSVSGNVLTINSPVSYSGIFLVQVQATDGMVPAPAQSFAVYATNTPTTLAAINDVQFSHSLPSYDVTLSSTDPDPGENITYNVTLSKYTDLTSLNATYHFFKDPNASPADPYHQDNLSGNDPAYVGTRWIYSGASAYYLRTDGSLYRWGGKTTSNAHTFDTLITKLPFFVYNDPSLLWNAQAQVDPNTVPIVKSVSGNTLTLDPPASYAGIFQVSVTASDSASTTAPRTFAVYVSNSPPSLAPLSDITYVHSAGGAIVGLSSSDADGDAITYNVVLSQYTALTSLNNTYHFYTDPNASPADPYHQNNLAANDPFYTNTRWFYSNFNGFHAYYLKNDGNLYRWGGSTAGNAHTFDSLVTKLPAFVYTDPTLLINAQTQADPNAAGVTKSVSGNTLTLLSPTSYTGIYQVTVSAGDGVTSSTPQTFAVYSSNNAPTLAPLNDLSFSHTTPSVNVNLSSSDADGDTITYNVTYSSYNGLVQAQQTYQFYTDPNASPADPYHQNNLASIDAFYTNTRWIYSNTGGFHAYYLKNDGSLYRWGGSTSSNAHLSDTLVTKFGFFVYDDPTLLLKPGTPPNPSVVGKTVTGNTLTIDPPNLFTGVFQVTVAASDGAASSTRTFLVYVSDNAPTIAPIPNQTMTHASQPLVVNLSVADADGDAVTIIATPNSTQNPLKLLDDQYQFSQDFSDYRLNFYGYQEKWLLSNANGNHYAIVPPGKVVHGSTLTDYHLFAITNNPADPFGADIGAVSADVYNNPSLLWNAQSGSVSIVQTGSQLSFTVTSNFYGTFTVTVSASDGMLTTTRSFTVTVN